MAEMYCPQCGRELVLDSGEIRFCRYCGFSLADTKDALHGYSEQKRMGFSLVTWSYVVLLIVTLLLHGKYVSLDTRWVYWLLTALIVASASFFISAAFSAMKPALFLKKKRRDQATLDSNPEVIAPRGDSQATTMLPSAREPAAVMSNRGQKEVVREARSIVEGTTRKLNDN